MNCMPFICVKSLRYHSYFRLSCNHQFQCCRIQIISQFSYVLYFYINENLPSFQDYNSIKTEMQVQVKSLITKKDEIQEKIRNLDIQLSVMTATKSYDKNLVDDEGFPRADLDFGQLSKYRILKRTKAELNNDHLALMKQIQKGLFALHAEYKQKNIQNVEEIQQEKPFKKIKKQPYVQPQIVKKQTKIPKEDFKSKIDYLTPFAKISMVAQNSPAFLGGIKVQDLLSEFAEINIYSMSAIKEIPRQVKQGVQIGLVLMRRVDGKGQNVFELKDGNLYQKIVCKITPKRWQGAGLLGCKIDPLIKQ